MAAYDQFLLFGDSLFQHSSSQERGFSLASGLQAEYIRRLDIVNRGFSGYNTGVLNLNTSTWLYRTYQSTTKLDQALKILPRIIPPPSYARIRFLVIFFGANDACLEGAQGSQHVPLQRYRQNLIDIINHPAVKAHDPRIIVVTPPPMNEYAAEDNDRTKGILEPRRSTEHTKMYADTAREVAKQQNVAVLDLWSALMKHAGWSEGQYPLPGSKKIPPNPFMRMLLHDGLHFTNIAYTLYHQEIMRVIGKRWPDQTPEQLKYVFPEWNNAIAWQDATQNGV